MCVQFFHMVSIDVPAGVGAPPLNTTSEHASTDKVCQPCQMRNPQHPSTDPSKDTWKGYSPEDQHFFPNEQHITLS